MIRAVGLDMAFANVGLCRVRIEPNAKMPAMPRIVCEGLHLISTEAGNRKVVRVSSDDLRRGRELHAGISMYLGEGASFIFAEVPSGAKDAKAASLLGMAKGILACLPLPLIEVTPLEVKEAVTGRRGKEKVPKAEVIRWAVSRWPDAPWVRHERSGKGFKPGDLQNCNEHLADALAAVAAGIRTPEFQRILALGASGWVGNYATSSTPDQRPASRRIPFV